VSGTKHVKEFSFITPEAIGSSYEEMCDIAGLPATEHGWGLLHCNDDDDVHWTQVTDDPQRLRDWLATGSGVEVNDRHWPPGSPPADLPKEMFLAGRRGWPHEWGRKTRRS